MSNASQIAEKNLRACFKGRGITASVKNFHDFWARDSFFASWGLLELGESERVRSNLEFFADYQKKDGQIPTRIDRHLIPLNYLGIRIHRKKLRPTFRGARLSKSLDPNILFVITCRHYLKKSKKKDFLEEYFESIQKAISWLEAFEKDSLLVEGKLANWMDSILKSGAVLYTNVLYFEGLKSFSEICHMADKKNLSRLYAEKADALKKRINEKFWNGDYYSDWIKGKKRYDFFSTDGNVLAMLFGISDDTQSKKIIDQITERKLDKFPMTSNDPAYPWWRVTMWTIFRGTPGYQNHAASWPWLGSAYSVALHKNGYKKEAKVIQRKIAAQIKKYKTVYETYALDGSPYKGWFWRPTNSFAWGAGLFLWAENII